MKKPTSKDTKAQILSAYKELDEAYRELLREKRSWEKAPSQKPSAKTPPSAEPAKDKGGDGAEMKIVIEEMARLNDKFNTALSRLSADLLVEASRLRDVRSDADEETRRLSELHGLEIGEHTIGELLKQYAETSKSVEKESEEKLKALENELEEKNRSWQEEKEETLRKIKEQKLADDTERKRGMAEYSYNLELERNLSQEEYERQRKEQEQAMEEMRQAREKEWEEKEKEVADREKEFEENKQKVEDFPKELEKAVKKAKEEGTGIARRQAKIKAELREKEISGEQAVHTLKISTLEEEIAKQVARIATLSQQLDTATRQAQELAVRAIEGASSQASFKELKELALEQAKNPSKSK